jgi:hypothetical protein
MATQTKSGPKVCIKTITPKYAAELLQKNYEGQRKPNLSAVEQFTRLIVEGKWRVTNDAVTLSADNRLINGQHRLLACIAADKPIDVSFMTEADEDIYKVIDNGVARSATMLLSGAGISYGALGASALRFLWIINNSKMSPADAIVSLDSGSNKRRCTPSELLETAEIYRDEFHDVCRRAQGNGPRFMAAPIEIARIVLFYFFAKVSGADTETVDEFLYQLSSTDSDLRSNSGPRKLRDDSLARRASRVKLPVAHTVALLTKAYNAYVDGRPIHRIAWSNGEEFPKVLPGPCKSTDQ